MKGFPDRSFKFGSLGRKRHVKYAAGTWKIFIRLVSRLTQQGCFLPFQMLRLCHAAEEKMGDGCAVFHNHDSACRRLVEERSGMGRKSGFHIMTIACAGLKVLFILQDISPFDRGKEV